MAVLGVSLVVMGVLSLTIFSFAVGGGVTVNMEGGHIKTFKGEEYETILTVESRASDWIGSMPPTVNIRTSHLIISEPVGDGRTRLRFLARYAGRSDGVEVGIWLTDPLRLMKRLEQVVYTELVVDTLPLSLLAPPVQQRMMIFGSGERPIGYPGPGQELYGLNEYQSGDTKDIIWKRLAKSPEEKLTARIREANGKDSIKVGIVQFQEREGEDAEEWMDRLCEALGHIGKNAIEMGAAFTALYHVSSSAGWREEGNEEEGVATGRERGSGGGTPGSPGLVRVTATDILELAEAVMECSLASPSREVWELVSSSDLVVTGLEELEDERLASLLSRTPTVLIADRDAEARTPVGFARDPVFYSGSENLSPLTRKILGR